MHFLELMFVVTAILVLLSFRSPAPLSRAFYIFVGLIFFSFVVFVWLSAIRQSQLAPHHITQSINGHVISEFWTTNPVYVTSRGALVSEVYLHMPGLRGSDLVTNYYWTVWSIFK